MTENQDEAKYGVYLDWKKFLKSAATKIFQRDKYILTAQGAKSLGAVNIWKKFQLLAFHTYNPGLHLNTDLHAWQSRNYYLFRS